MPPLLTAAEKKTSTQVSQANNLSSLDYGLYLSVPNYLERNVDDDQQPADLSGQYEKWDLDHRPSTGEDDVLEVTISAKALPSGGTVTLTIEGEVDAIVSPLQINGREIIYWTDSIKSDRYHKENHRQITWQLPQEGDSNGILNEAMFIEGVKVTTIAKAIKFTAVLKTGGHTVTVVKDTGVFECDSDTDSLNDHEFEFAGFDKSEDQIEKSELKIANPGPQKPGKFITNTSNANFDDDQITDYADGFGLIGASGSNPDKVSTDLQFTPVEIKLKKPYTTDAYVTISYGTVSMPELSAEGLAMHGDGSKLHPYAYTANKGGLRFWNVKPDKRAGGNKQAGEGGNFIYPGKIYKWTDINKTLGTSADENVIETAQLFVEYVETYPSQAHGKREITVSITEDYVTTTDKFTVTLLPVTLAVDNNRDGYVQYGDYRDHTHKNQQYRFWVNNDSDMNGGDTSNPEVDNPWAAVSNPDCNIGAIGQTCQRNLEDFTRLHMQLDSNPIWYRSHGVTVKLKWQKYYSPEQPEIRLYETFENDGSRKYLNDDASSLTQTYEPALPKLGAGDCAIPDNLINTDGTVYMIYEGVKEGAGRVCAELRYNGNKIGEVGALYLDIEDIRNMYEQKRIQASANFPGPDTSTYSAPTGVASIDDPRGSFLETAWDEDTDNKSYTICVHGWDKTWNAARSDEQTVFKRMWQRGFKGRYIGFYWPTYTGKTTYNHSEYVAWNCGIALKNLVNSLPADYKKNVIAHSMGNIVVGSALEKGAKIDNYAILNSAAPAQCYDSSHIQEVAITQHLSFSKMGWGVTIPIPVPYYPFIVNIAGIDYPAWNKAELSDDSVFGALGYKAKIPVTNAKLINYYLINDEATVDLWEANQWGAVDIPLYLDSKIIDNYIYEPTIELSYNYTGLGVRNLTDKFEAMSMVNQSRTKSAGGTTTTIRASNAIKKNVNLAGFGFGVPGVGNDLLHEAVFTRRYCKSWDFYGSLLVELNYLPTP